MAEGTIPTIMSRFAIESVPATVADDASLQYVELDGYRFHVHTFGDRDASPIVVVHGGPGGDSNSLLPLQLLADDHFVIFYDQRGTGLSPRVPRDHLTLEASLSDLHLIAQHYAKARPVKLIGHSWGAMLTIAYVGRHPALVSHAVAVEPGILTAASAVAFASRLKASGNLRDSLAMIGYLIRMPLVRNQDGHEALDFVMTKMMNRSKLGGPYQCEGQAMPPDAVKRAGFASFSSMMKPVLKDPAKFSWNLASGTEGYEGGLLMLSSECSFIGHSYQEEFHLPLLPRQTIHVLAKGMGHNMLTLNSEWSADVIRNFFSNRPDPLLLPAASARA